MMANIVAMFHSALHMDDGYVNHIAIVQDVATIIFFMMRTREKEPQGQDHSKQ